MVSDLSGQSLEPYYCLSSRLDVRELETADESSFDSNGVILADGGYHPVSISRFGILCLDEFALTNDSTFFTHAVNQLNYFRSDSLTHTLFNGMGIGLPYLFPHKGLEPPWYSGLGQGLAVSFLLRLYEYTQEPELIQLSKGIMHVLMQPQTLGGCMSKTDEDLIWIEEYPNCLASPQVLNGFIFAFIGLWEYCEFFPGDGKAVKLKKECLNTLKRSLPTYDSRTWTRYNKRKVYPIREFYLRLQIFQMRHLYRLTNDPFFLRQSCIWAAFDLNQPKSDDLPFVHFDEQPFTIPCRIEENKIIVENSEPIDYDEIENGKMQSYSVPPFPWYGFATTVEYVFERPMKFSVSVDSSLSDVHVFYRYHWDTDLFELEKWQATNAVSSNEQIFHLQPGIYQFAVFFEDPLRKKEYDVYRFHFSDP